MAGPPPRPPPDVAWNETRPLLVVSDTGFGVAVNVTEIEVCWFTLITALDVPEMPWTSVTVTTTVKTPAREKTCATGVAPVIAPSRLADRVGTGRWRECEGCGDPGFDGGGRGDCHGRR